MKFYDFKINSLWNLCDNHKTFISVHIIFQIDGFIIRWFKLTMLNYVKQQETDR